MCNGSKEELVVIAEPITTNSELEIVDGENALTFEQEAGFVKHELLDTLTYIKEQLELIDTKTKMTARFSRNVFETKKLFVEQKLTLLKQLSSLAVDKVKYIDDDDGDVPNIVDIMKTR